MDYFYDCKCGIVHYRERNCNAKLLRGSPSHSGTLLPDMHAPCPPFLHFQEMACAIQGYHPCAHKDKVRSSLEILQVLLTPSIQLTQPKRRYHVRAFHQVGIGKSNGLFHRLRPPTPCHPAATLPAAARAWGRPARPAPAACRRQPALARTGGWGRAACTAGTARGAIQIHND